MTTQFQIINKILQTSDYSIVTSNNLNADHFFSYQKEFRFIKDFYDKYKSVPSRLTFLDSFADFDMVDVSDPDSYLIEQLFKEYNTKVMASRFNEVRRLIENNQLDAALDYYVNSVEDIQTGAAITCVDLTTDVGRYNRYLERVNSRKDFFLSTGFPELDAITGGIDLKEENMVIAARTGQGKSWTLLKIAVEAAKLGKTVGIYSGEMSADKVGYRVDTLLGHIDNKAITRGNNYDTSVQVQYKHYIDNIKEYCPGSIKVLTPNDIQGPATVAALKAFVEREHLDILLIDQYSLLEDQRHAKALHEKVANISKDIKNLQVMAQIPIISVSQMNRTKNEDGEQDTTQIGLSDRIGQDATSIIMLSREIKYRDPEKRQIADDRLVLNIVKSRDGGAGKLVYRADFNTGNFTFLNPNLSDSESEELHDYYEDDEGYAPPSDIPMPF